jgi:hypothetical protein
LGEEGRKEGRERRGEERMGGEREGREIKAALLGLL